MNNGLELYLAYKNDLIRTGYNRELTEEDFLPFEDFGNQEKPNLARTKALFDGINDKCDRIWALASCLHRERDHEEDNKLEQIVVSDGFTTQELSISEALSWWSNGIADSI